MKKDFISCEGVYNFLNFYILSIRIYILFKYLSSINNFFTTKTVAYVI